jgi:uncharacterized protein
MKKILISFTVTALFVFLFFVFYSPSLRESSNILLGERLLSVWIAENAQSRTKGLSGVESLDDVDGMLFIFDKEDFHSFWMKEMNFAIDIIWINKEMVVVDITENILSETYPELFVPKLPAKYVLEVEAGWSERNSVELGEELVLMSKL